VQRILQYKQALKEAALNLSGDKRLPIPVTEITDSLGVKISRAKADGRTKGHLLLTVPGPEIVLPWANNGTSTQYTSWERFIIAHELGHIVLDRTCDSRPLGKSEYWQHEELCDTFARWLLLPSWVSKVVAGSRRTPSQRLNLCQHLKHTADVPWRAAAFRISEWDPTTRFLLLQKKDNRGFKVAMSTFPGKRGIRTLVPPGVALGKALFDIPLDEPLNLEADVFSCFEFATGLKSALAFRTTPDEIRLALIGAFSSLSAAGGAGF
jgi:hypothetical protein